MFSIVLPYIKPNYAQVMRGTVKWWGHNAAPYAYNYRLAVQKYQAIGKGQNIKKEKMIVFQKRSSEDVVWTVSKATTKLL
jgi:hypothetical protein